MNDSPKCAREGCGHRKSMHETRANLGCRHGWTSRPEPRCHCPEFVPSRVPESGTPPKYVQPDCVSCGKPFAEHPIADARSAFGRAHMCPPPSLTGVYRPAEPPAGGTPPGIVSEDMDLAPAGTIMVDYDHYRALQRDAAEAIRWRGMADTAGFQERGLLAVGDEMIQLRADLASSRSALQQVREAALDYLEVDGSNGNYDAMALAKARLSLRAALTPSSTGTRNG